MLTDSAWHVAKWMSIAVCVAYIGAQVLAERRLRGDFERRGHVVLVTVAVASMVQNWIDAAFENPEASRIAMVLMGAVAAVATAALISLLYRQKVESKTALAMRVLAES